MILMKSMKIGYSTKKNKFIVYNYLHFVNVLPTHENRLTFLIIKFAYRSIYLFKSLYIGRTVYAK